MKYRGQHIADLARERGSSATTHAGAWRYLLTRLAPEHEGIWAIDGDRGAYRRRAECNDLPGYARRRAEHRADGRARVLGYPESNPEYADYAEAYRRNEELARYQREYVARAKPIADALVTTVSATWHGADLYVALPGGLTARVTWDVDSDWDYYAKSYGRPKNTISNRRVEVWRWTPEAGLERVLAIAVEAFRGYWLRRVLLEVAQRLELPALTEAVRSAPTKSEREKQELMTPKPCYKRVAVRQDGAYVSIFDGTTTYRLGEVVQDTPRRCPDYDDICGYGGIFVHATAAKAKAQKYPEHSQAVDLPRVTLRGEYWGRANVNGKIAAEYFRPVAVEEA